MKLHEYTVTEEEILTFKKRRYVRRMTSSAIDRGDLIRADTCELCFRKKKTQAHHIDYGKPFHVKWLCSTCHGRVHRIDNAWNPTNNEQTPLPVELDRYDSVHITFTLPSKNFLALREEAIKKGVKVNELLKSEAIERFKVKSKQLEFNFEENMNDKSQNDRHERVSRLEENEIKVLQPKRSRIQKVQSTRNLNLLGMEGELFSVPRGHGSNAPELQRTYAY